MKKIILFLIIFLLLPFDSWAACTGSSPTWTTTPDQTSVVACVDSAKAGDTINVTAGNGSATWSNYNACGSNRRAGLCITKSVYLIGPGASNLEITYTGGEGASGGAAISYVPSNATTADTLRISGFTFAAGSGQAIYLLGHLISYTDAQIKGKKIRIDNNTFNDDIYITGYRGVIDNNTFNVSYAIRHVGGTGNNWWNNWEGFVFGKADNSMYFEDNTFNNVAGTMVNAQSGNRYIFRYNTINGTGSHSPLFDMHGNQGEGNFMANFGMELYGNKVTGTAGNYMTDLRSGKSLIFNNIFPDGNSNTFKIREEVWDGYNTVTKINQQPQHVHDTYLWNNRDSSSGALRYAYLASNVCASTIGQSSPICSDQTHGYSLNADDEWHDYISSGFNGTTGVGCGTLANRPATCTTGVGYWVTDQSCSNLTGLVGAVDSEGDRPDTSYKISGTLYKCTAKDTWTAYYTPYTYPHPLRTDAPADETHPLNQQAGNSISADGLTLTLNHSESITKTGDGTIVVTCDGEAAAQSYTSGSGAANLVYTFGAAVTQNKVCTVAYTQGGNDLEDAAGNDLATYTGHTIRNESRVSAGGDTFDLTVAVVGGGTVNSSQGGVQCTRDNTPCTKTVDDGTVITFTLVPFPGHNAGVITGTGCGSSTTVDAAKSCTVTFPAIPIL